MITLSPSSERCLLSVYVAPAPNNVQQLTSNQCLDRRHNPAEWFYMRPKPGHCVKLHSLFNNVHDDDHHSTTMDHLSANDIVFVFQFPNPRDGSELAMSRLHQTMLSVFTVSIDYDIDYKSGDYIHTHTHVTR